MGSSQNRHNHGLTIILPEPKKEHFKRIQGWSGFKYDDMVLILIFLMNRNDL